jgi:hypothetical protein
MHMHRYDALMTGAVFAALAPLARATASSAPAADAVNNGSDTSVPASQQQQVDGQYTALEWVQQYQGRLNLVGT